MLHVVPRVSPTKVVGDLYPPLPMVAPPMPPGSVNELLSTQLHRLWGGDH